MKKQFKNLFILASVVLPLMSCEFLQGTLSSEMEKKVQEETGKASIASKYWFYNGTKTDDMSTKLELGSENYEDVSLLVNFAKKVALQSENPSGYIELSYVDSDGISATKKIPSITGSFTEDFTAYKVNMANVLSYFDTTTIPSGVASMEIKISGFVCAEGNQNGRSIPALVHKMTIMPLYSSYEIDFSTCWYKDGDYVSFQLNGDVTVPSKTIVSEEGFEFEISSKDSEIFFTPKENLFEKVGQASFLLNDILPKTSGESYSKKITLNFVKDAIVIDGKEDLNYSNERASSVLDTSGDQNAFSSKGYDVSANADITKLSLVNDSENLYISVAGNLSFTWNDGLVIMIAKEGVSQQVDRSIYKACDNENLKPLVKQTPFAYLYHKPGNENSGTGKWAIYSSVTGSTKEITENCAASPQGWTDSTTGIFLEYAIPLSDLELNADDDIYVIACASLHWDDGAAVCDIAPNESLTEKYTNEDRTEVMYDFSKGLHYIVK